MYPSTPAGHSGSRAADIVYYVGQIEKIQSAKRVLHKAPVFTECYTVINQTGQNNTLTVIPVAFRCYYRTRSTVEQRAPYRRTNRHCCPENTQPHHYWPEAGRVELHQSDFPDYLAIIPHRLWVGVHTIVHSSQQNDFLALLAQKPDYQFRFHGTHFTDRRARQQTEAAGAFIP